MKSQARFLKISLAGLTVIAACATAAVACSNTDSGDDSAAAGTGGTGTASAGAAGTATATAGASTSGGGTGGTSAVVAMGTACPKATSAALSDFSALDGGGGDPSAFGDFATTFSGSSYVYPNGAANFPLVADFSQQNWHITGTVGDFSGFGLVFSLASSATGGCDEVDASMFSGISFSIKGSVPIAGALANSVQFTVGTAADDVAASWLDAHKATPTTADATPSFGTCMPVSNQYDGTCGSPSLKVPLTDTATVINVKWTDLVGGKPAASPDPTKITFISWVIPTPPGAGGASPTTYMVDLTIDDLQFLP